MSILEKIAESRRNSIGEVNQAVRFIRNIRHFNKQSDFLTRKRKTLSEVLMSSSERGGMGVISELKVASPSKGSFIENQSVNLPKILDSIYKNLNAVNSEQRKIQEILNYPTIYPTMPDLIKRASEMVNYGAIALSILTEPAFFGGSFGNLLVASLVMDNTIPLLLKDFIVDSGQLTLGKICGASSALLIVKLCTDSNDLLNQVRQYHAHGLEPLIELHDKADFELVKPLKGLDLRYVLGINNRNLIDLTIDFNASKNLIPKIRNFFGLRQPVITESGVTSRQDVLRLKTTGAQAALVGSSISESGITNKLDELYGTNTIYFKICGISRLNTVQKLSSEVINAVGVVTGVHDSHRNVSVDKAGTLFDHVPDGKMTVLVTKGRSTEEILLLSEQLQPDLLQNHVKDPVDYIISLPLALQFKTILPINMNRDSELMSLLKGDDRTESLKNRYSRIPGNIYGVLIDTSEGSGLQQDLNILKRAKEFFGDTLGFNVIVAGGIGIQNVAEIINHVHPFGIDLSSSVETNRFKDITKINKFVQILKEISKSN